MLVIGPLSECNVGSEMFAFYLDRLVDVHRFSPQILEVFSSEPDVESWYPMIAGFLWEPTSNVSIVSIMEIVMATNTARIFSSQTLSGEYP
jgi:hypothetical protein